MRIYKSRAAYAVLTEIQKIGSIFCHGDFFNAKAPIEFDNLPDGCGSYGIYLGLVIAHAFVLEELKKHGENVDKFKFNQKESEEVVK